jgi:transcriptional regulator of acetoin/glycerol metabolism
VARQAGNPWVALDVASDPVAHARRLREIYERGPATGAPAPGGIRELVLESWHRSLALGVTPGAAGAPVLLTGDVLEHARQNSPLGPIVDVIRTTLARLDGAARQVVAIADADANLLWVGGDPYMCERAHEMGFQEGASWSEAGAGTNAVGTAAALDHPVQIFSAEHLVAAVHAWTCSAAPIHDPVTGQLIGVVDLTAELLSNHPHTLSLAALAAQAAEADLHARSLQLAARLREQWLAAIAGRRTPTALLDPHGRVLATSGAVVLPSRVDVATVLDDLAAKAGELQQLEGGGAILWLRRAAKGRARRLRLRLLGRDVVAQIGSRRERGLRSLELLAVLAMHPEGLTAEQLALALYGERGKAVTIRAQVHRVRAQLGEDVVNTQPYRLLVGIDADWLAVEHLVSAGRPADALRGYRGSLLPASDAPMVAERRALLEESLRRAILTTADAQLLERWLEHPCGADDLPAARALVAVLPSGDPRRAAATARAAAIARRLA